MNLATFITLLIVLFVLSVATYNLCRMVRRNDLCYACPNSGRCECGNPINCSIHLDDKKE